MPDQGTPRRLRVLISAYACGPGDEPEANAGWAFACAAARHHDVVAITRARFRPAVEAALAADPELAASLTVVHVELPRKIAARQRRGWDVYWYYALWQRAMAKRALELHRANPFDVGHHVTFANDWLPCGLRRLPLPLVWGPVGGASRVPMRTLARWLGPRGTIIELARESVVRLARRLWGDPVAARAAVVVAQNYDVAERFRHVVQPGARVFVEPNAAFRPEMFASTDELPAESLRESSSIRRAIFVGRLIPFKGGRLAVAAMAEPELTNWHLDIYGVGSEEAAMRRIVDRAGIAGHVTFHGHHPREEILRAFRTADAMIFPSMHDQAGWVAGEASALGCPVICLPLGGPHILAGPNAIVVEIDRHLPSNLAVAVASATRDRHHYNRWGVERLPALVDDWYRAAAAEK